MYEDAIAAILNEAIAGIRDTLEQERINATGKASESLEVETYEGGARMLGCGYFSALEQGNEPIIDPTLEEAIREWINAKIARGWFTLRGGKDTEEERDKAAYYIANSLQERGTKLYQQGGRDDVYTDKLKRAVSDIQAKLAGVAEIQIKESLEKKL